jgi:hypothetical protein
MNIKLSKHAEKAESLDIQNKIVLLQSKITNIMAAKFAKQVKASR